jgi:oligoendopeptidase F
MSNETIPHRSDIPAEDTWDLSPLFPDDTAWENQYLAIESRISGYESFKGALHQSFDTFKRCLDLDNDLSRELDKITTFAHLKNDEDKTNPVYAGFFQRAMNLLTRMSDASSFIWPEILDLPSSLLDSWRARPEIEEYRFYLEKIVRSRPHTLSVDVEQVLAQQSELFQAPRQIFGQLDNADMTFGTIEDADGRRIELSHGNFITCLNNPDGSFRERAFRQYYAAYESHKHTLSETLAASIRKDVALAKIRRHRSALSSSLFVDDVGEAVYDTLSLHDALPIYNGRPIHCGAHRRGWRRIHHPGVRGLFHTHSRRLRSPVGTTHPR